MEILGGSPQCQVPRKYRLVSHYKALNNALFLCGVALEGTLTIPGQMFHLCIFASSSHPKSSVASCGLARNKLLAASHSRTWRTAVVTLADSSLCLHQIFKCPIFKEKSGAKNKVFGKDLEIGKQLIPAGKFYPQKKFPTKTLTSLHSCHGKLQFETITTLQVMKRIKLCCALRRPSPVFPK